MGLEIIEQYINRRKHVLSFGEFLPDLDQGSCLFVYEDRESKPTASKLSESVSC
jgi:hypothetical protein